MLIVIPQVLSAHEVEQFRTHLLEADWADGRSTAGSQSAMVKHNRQLPELSPLAQQLGNGAVDAHPDDLLRPDPLLHRRRAAQGGEQE